jgi:hypothetical protein
MTPESLALLITVVRLCNAQTGNAAAPSKTPAHATAGLDDVAAEVTELRDGQHELLRMYEELRDRYPKHCLCAEMRERARTEVLAHEVFAPDVDHEDYQPE